MRRAWPKPSTRSAGWILLVATGLIAGGGEGRATKSFAGPGTFAEPGGGQPDSTSPSAAAVAVTSLSNHYVEVEFDGPLAADGANPAAYRIRGGDGETLAVSDIALRADRRSAVLTTQAQLEIEYTLEFGSPPVRSSRCQADQLEAGRTLCKSQLRCWQHYAQDPGDDAQGAQLDSCLDAASLEFQSYYEKAISRAHLRGEACGLESAAGGVEKNAFTAPLSALLADPSFGPWVPASASRNDNALLRTMLRAAGHFCSYELGLESENAFAPDDAKLAAERSKGRARFDRSATSAVARWSRKGGQGAGIDPAGIAAAVETLVDDFVALTGGSPVDAASAATGGLRFVGSTAE